MALTVAQGFSKFLENLTPLQSQRDASAKHRDSVETSLRNALNVKMFRESGSFSHGTGVRNHSDVDLLVSINAGDQPGSSATALNWVKDALSTSFPSTIIKISRPAVVVLFNGGKETWELIPGFRKNTGDAALYDIPGVGDVAWMESAPTEHIKYVNEVNQEAGISGGAKRLVRLAKGWKYYNNVPVSSFYLEMRAAKFLSGHKVFDPVQDVCYLFEHLVNIELCAMNDPKGLTARFYACSSTTKATDAMSKVRTAATRSRKALDAHQKNNPAEAFTYLNLLFGGQFPAR